MCLKVLGDTYLDQALHLQRLQVWLIPSQVGQHPTLNAHAPFYTHTNVSLLCPQVAVPTLLLLSRSLSQIFISPKQTELCLSRPMPHRSLVSLLLKAV